MQNHVKNYFKAFGYDKSDIILCEHCHATAIDIHHIEPRSKFGSKMKEQRDAPDNLIALCRKCHDRAHGVQSETFKNLFKGIVDCRNFKSEVEKLKKLKGL